MSNSNLPFSFSEASLATLALSVVAAAVPLYYLTRNTNQQNQETSPHIHTFKKYLHAYSTLRPQALVANATSSFTHTILPSSLGLPSRTLVPFKEHAAKIFSLFQDFKMIPQPENGPNAIHVSRDTNTVIAHCKMGGKIDGTSENGKKLVEQNVTEWWLECVLFVEMDPTGRRVVGVKEFVDGVKSEELKKRLMGVLES